MQPSDRATVRPSNGPVANYVVKAGDLTLPSSSEQLFGRDAPLVVEVGVGSGTFICDFATQEPHFNVLGIDRAPQSIARTYRRIRRERLPNVRLFKGNAEWVLRNVVPASHLRRAYVNFPDPWPRAKHRDRRLLQRPFLRLLSSRLRRDGELLLTTDHRDYFEFVLENAEAAGCFSVDVQTPPSELLQTKWARKASSHYHARLSPMEPANDFPIETELTESMYHAVLQGELPELTGFEKRTHRMGDDIIVLMDVYQKLESPGFAFLAHVEEQGLSQEVIIEVREGKRGYVVGLRRFGEPLHTRGLSAAVRCVADWLVDRGMIMIHKKY